MKWASIKSLLVKLLHFILKGLGYKIVEDK